MWTVIPCNPPPPPFNVNVLMLRKIDRSMVDESNIVTDRKLLLFSKTGHPRHLFVLFSFFSNNLQNKTVDFSGIWTRIIGVKGEHADHLTMPQPQFISCTSTFSLRLLQTVSAYLWYKIDIRNDTWVGGVCRDPANHLIIVCSTTSHNGRIKPTRSIMDPTTA